MIQESLPCTDQLPA